MDEMQWFAQQFEANRPHLRAVAYRMLGSINEADDALQEAWIRTTRSESTAINNINGWLTTLVGRVCIDMLRARQVHNETSGGTWMPEPMVSAGDSVDPEQASLLADSVGLALMVVLESLEPAERLAFVLHDMFAVPFDEIAPIVDRSPVAARQLASRARRRVRGTGAAPDADLPTQRRVVDAFLAASRDGNFEALLTILDPDVVFRVDTGQRTWLAPALLAGARDVAEHAATHGPRFASLCEPALVNGAAGILTRTKGGIVAVVGITVVNERIAEIDLMLDKDKLSALTISG
ncbi:sigma-70 family RNA polymerase sigma factor [Actinomadura coerulea]|uniref:sigma-70 family RNA polymerase sigma factor n=1 Tax=Actinomadura coerulea TaxID=46159 RepID=UPI0034365D11